MVLKRSWAWLCHQITTSNWNADDFYLCWDGYRVWFLEQWWNKGLGGCISREGCIFKSLLACWWVRRHDGCLQDIQPCAQKIWWLLGLHSICLTPAALNAYLQRGIQGCFLISECERLYRGMVDVGSQGHHYTKQIQRCLLETRSKMQIFPSQSLYFLKLFGF